MATDKNGKVLYEGINEEYLKDHFITAYFIDNERKNIEVVCNKPDFKTVFTSIVKYEDGDAQWEDGVQAVESVKAGRRRRGRLGAGDGE